MKDATIFLEQYKEGLQMCITSSLLCDDLQALSEHEKKRTLSSEMSFYGYRLRNADDILALHPKRYLSCRERDEAFKQLWRKLRKGVDHLYSGISRHSGILIEVEEVRREREMCEPPQDNTFHFQLIDRANDEVLWRSWNAYATEEAAMAAFEKQYLKVIGLAQSASNYREERGMDGGLRIILFDDDKKRIAEFPIEKESARSQAIIQKRVEHALQFPILLSHKEYTFRLFDVEQNKVLWESTMTYKDLESAEEAFEHFLKLLLYERNWITDGGSNVGSWGFHLGNILLESRLIYPSQEEAWEAIKPFLLEVQKDPGIWPVKAFGEKCSFGIEAVGPAFGVAKHPVSYQTYEEREWALYRLLTRTQCRNSFRSRIAPGYRCINGAYHFILEDPISGKELWESYQGYPSRRAAEEAFDSQFLQVMELAKEPGFYCLVKDSEGNCQVQLVDLEGRGVARIPEILGSGLFRAEAVRLRILHARLYPFTQSDEGYHIQIYDPEFSLGKLHNLVPDRSEGGVWEPEVGLSLRDPCPENPEMSSEDVSSDCGEREQEALWVFLQTQVTGAVIWEGQLSYGSLNEAECAFVHLEENILNNPTAYKRRDSDDCGPYTIWLTDPNECLATHPRYYTSATTREEGSKTLKELINREGFHVLEHILLRPLQRREEAIRMEVILDENKEAPLYPFRREFHREEVVSKFFDSFIEKAIQAIESGFLNVEGDTFAKQLSYIDSTAVPDVWKHLLSSYAKQELRDRPKDKIDLNFPRIRSQQGGDLLPICVDFEECQAIPAIEDIQLPEIACGSPELVEERKLLESYLPGADPYSFYMTVALPFWPSRFLNPNFRTFFEESIRRESPAHVWVNILWLSPQQMQEFECAYKDWLTAKTGLASCDLIDRQRELIQVLTDLRNEYLPAQISGCEPTREEELIFLDQTKLG